MAGDLASEGCVPAGLVVQLPSSPAKPPAHHADIMIPTSTATCSSHNDNDDQTMAKGTEPINSTDDNSQLCDLLRGVNDKLNDIDSIFSLIRTMADEQTKLKSEMTEVKSSLDDHQKQCQTRNTTISKMQDTIAQKDKHHSELIGQLTELQSENTRLIVEKNRNKWEKFRNQPSGQRTILVGSSEIRDIDQNKLLNTDVKCLPGAKVSDLTKEVSLLPTDKYCNIVLVGGGNDCSNTKDATSVVNSFKDVISAAKLKAASVTVASVCPRGDPEVQSCSDNVNAAVQGMCTDLACTFCDTTDMLKLTDGTINEGFYLDDLVHLTFKGQNKVAKKLELIPAQSDAPYNVVSNQRNRSKTLRGKAPVQNQPDRRYTREASDPIRHAEKDATNSREANTPTYRRQDGHDKRSHSPDRSTRKTRCHYCAEPNHREDRCHHQGPVKCLFFILFFKIFFLFCSVITYYKVQELSIHLRKKKPNTFVDSYG